MKCLLYLYLTNFNCEKRLNPVYFILPHSALHCPTLHCRAVPCPTLHCTDLLCMPGSALPYPVLHCSALHWPTLYCIALHYFTLYCPALQCLTLYCAALPSLHLQGDLEEAQKIQTYFTNEALFKCVKTCLNNERNEEEKNYCASNYTQKQKFAKWMPVYNLIL